MKIIYEDENVKVFDKPAGITIDNFDKPAHRLDKDTSGVLLTTKNDATLEFLQKQFQERKVKKHYIALVVGCPSSKTGKIETLIGRSPKDRKKQKVYLLNEPQTNGKRNASTEYKVLKQYDEYTLLEVVLKTGRKHQIRCHLAYISCPIVGDKLYGFKNQPCPAELTRQFLHARYLKIQLPDGKEKEFVSELPNDLKKVIKMLK